MPKGFSEKSFYAYKFLSDCLPVYALYTILFREKGLSLTEISLLLSVWSFVTLLLEVPSGILADRWNRRRMLCIAMLLKAACYVLWCVSDTFLLYGAGFVFWGVSGAFTSGTEEGLVYDNLKSENREDAFIEIYGKGNSYASLGTFTAILSSGFLASFFSINAIALLSAAVCVVCLLPVLRLKEKNYYSERQKEEEIGYFGTFSEAAKLCVKNKGILFSMVFLVLVISLADYLDEYDALIIDDFQSGRLWISAIFTVRFACTALGGRIAHKIGEWAPSKNTPFVLAIAAGLSLLVFSLVWRPFAIFALGAACLLMAVSNALLMEGMQKEIKEEGRTTVLSLYSMAQNSVMILFSLLYALLAGIFSLQTVYVLLSAYCVTGALCFPFFRRILGASPGRGNSRPSAPSRR